MFNLFSGIKKLFSRKKQPEEALEAPAAPVPVIVEEPQAEEKPKPSLDRKERNCSHCGAPNDVFVNKCWLCKKNI